MKPPFRLLAPHPTMCCSKRVTSVPIGPTSGGGQTGVPPADDHHSLEAGSGERGTSGRGAVSVQRQRSIIGAELDTQLCTS